MIIGYLADWKTYETLLPMLGEIQKIVLESGDKPVGRYETDWGFYMIQEGETYPVENGAFESHKKYLDVQCLVKGAECLEWQDVKRLRISEDYSEKKDVQFLHGTGNLSKITPGMFYVMFPEDGHKACCHIEEAAFYKKIVAKIKL